MKLTILHLSDMHFKSNDIINNNQINGIVSVLNKIEDMTKIIIICSGDVAYSGKLEEYEVSKRFLTNLSMKLKSKYKKFIPIYVLPGNHDLDLVGENINDRHEKILEAYKSNNLNTLVEEESSKFSNFMSFCNTNPINCFNDSFFIDKKIINIQKHKIQINLLNTAFFSSIKHIDKDDHFFDYKCLSNFRDEDTDFLITAMHHSTEWMHENYKNKMDIEIDNNSDILILGHNHISKSQKIVSNFGENIIVSNGGEYIDNDYDDKSCFNIIELDIGNSKATIYNAKWNKKKNIFQLATINASFFEFSQKNSISVSSKFIESLSKYTYSQHLIEDFIFPEISYKGDDGKDAVIKDYETFNRYLLNKKNLHILGSNKLGKTTLLDYLFVNLSKYYTVIYLKAAEIHNKNLKKSIRDAFEMQYSDNTIDFEIYEQLNSDRKVLLFDDVDKLSKVNITELIPDLNKYFHLIIMTSSDKINFNIIEKVKESIDESIINMKILPFYKIKRKELIGKIVKKRMGIQDNHVINKIEKSITDSSQPYMYTPELVIQYSTFVLESDQFEESNSFSSIFRSNLIRRIKKVVNNNYIEEYLYILKDIAYLIHLNKRIMITESDIMESIKQYNSTTGTHIKLTTFINNVIETNIFVEYGNEYRFSDKQILAYFIAEKIADRYLDDEKQGIKDIDYLLDNICFEINTDIFLFLIFFLRHKKIISEVYEYAFELMKNWEKFSIELGNITMLSKGKKERNIALPAKNEIRQIDDTQNKLERVKAESIKLDYSDIYDYDEEDAKNIVNQLTCSLKYIEILTRTLPIYYAMIPLDLKLIIIESIYEYTNKFLYYLLKPIDDKFDESIEEMLEYAKDKNILSKNNEEYTKTDMEEILTMFIRSVILSVYDKFASLCTSSKTISLLNQQIENNRDSSSSIFNLLMIEHSGNTNKLLTKAKEMTEKYKNYNIYVFIAYIMRKHLIYGDIDDIDRKKIIDTFFTVKEGPFIKNKSKEFIALSKKKQNKSIK